MVLKGVAYWASVQEPNTTYEPAWTLELVISKEDAEGLKKLSREIAPKGKPLTVKHDDRGYVVRIKRKVERSDGEKNQPPKVVDRQKNNIDCLIGNGSEVEVAFGLYAYRQGAGVATDLKAVRVLKLVPYSRGGVDEFEDLEGETEVVKEEELDDDDLPF